MEWEGREKLVEVMRDLAVQAGNAEKGDMERYLITAIM